MGVGKDSFGPTGQLASTIVPMDHDDHVNLLRDGIETEGGMWADFGAGRGAFTLALRELAGPDAEIIAIDLDAAALRTNEAAMQSMFPGAKVQYEVADFTGALSLPPLDGIVIANALHFQRDQRSVVQQLRQYLRDGGRVLVVEYNTKQPSAPVPYPVPFPRWQTLAQELGYRETRMLAKRPSRFLNEIYSAVSLA